MTKKAVLFNLWGVVYKLQPQKVFEMFEETSKLPRGFLLEVVSLEESAMRRAECGKITFSQMIPEFDAECVKVASIHSLALPPDFSVRGLFSKFRDISDINMSILQTSATLRQHGILTGVLANQWVDDSSCGDGSARLMSLLANHFDVVLQSCRTGHRVPEPNMFTSALQRLGTAPQQALWLDDNEESTKAAEGVGMNSLLVTTLPEALNKLTEFTGVQAFTGEIFPAASNPEEVSHGYTSIKPGVRLHYVEQGTGFPLLLCHGFPESWYSWRYQISALAEAGFRVIALDMKGYGDSSAPAEIEEYSQEQICQDLVTFLDKMAIPQVTLLGHDWGGALVWNMAQCYPERVRAVASLNTPLFPVDPSIPPMERLKSIPIFDYQIYFQEPSIAEAELEANLERTFKLFFFGSGDKESHPPLNTAGVRARGGLFVGAPNDVPRSSILSEAALKYYVSQFKKNGFRGPLNWYRNVERNWSWLCSRPRAKLLMPALMVTTGKDPVLLPVFSQGMENMIQNLTRRHIEECGHWTQMEKPSELNRILISWLQDTHKLQGVSRL